MFNTWIALGDVNLSKRHLWQNGDRYMTTLILPPVMKDVILRDAIQRDITTARRIALVEILWIERYLTRATHCQA